VPYRSRVDCDPGESWVAVNVSLCPGIFGGGVVLRLLTRAKLVGTATLLSRLFPQLEISHDPSKRTIGDNMSMGVLENLLGPDSIAFTKL
jgi:hypothetical protein